MQDEASSLDILREIRDYLAIIAEAATPAHDQSVLARLGSRAAQLRAVVNTPAQWDSLELLDGTRLVAEVATAVELDPSNFRKFVNRLTSAGFVTEGPRGPRLLLTRSEVAAVRRSE